MADFILTTGDTVLFNPSFGAAIVTPIPGTLVGTGRSTVGGKPVCVEGDEKQVVVPGVVYMSPAYPIPGVGVLKIDALAADQKGRETRSGGKPVLLKGGSFTAKLQVVTPAQQPKPPAPPTPDTTAEYAGTGVFVTTNLRVRGT